MGVCQDTEGSVGAEGPCATVTSGMADGRVPRAARLASVRPQFVEAGQPLFGALVLSASDICRNQFFVIGLVEDQPPNLV
eukprot:11225409-Lingulodinium_polyedra.AAC.1